jgi:transposase
VQKIKTVAMESTGVYWVALHEILESRGFEVCLVNARQAKNLPGRKTDVKDCQWLQQLHAYGLLTRSFRPQREIITLRRYLRHRETLVQEAGTCIQRIAKGVDGDERSAGERDQRYQRHDRIADLARHRRW